MRIAVAGGTGVVGRHIVRLAREAGHEVVVLSRSEGVDLVTGAGLDLSGVDAVIDASGPRPMRRATEFFEAVTGKLLRAGEAAGVRHHVALSIVGAAANPHGYYAAKARQEQLVTASAVPHTVLRTTQFFEFAEQTAIALGPLVLTAVMRSQPVAAESVARRLVELAEGEPLGIAPDFAGPDELRMVDLTRMALETRGLRKAVIAVPMPGAFGKVLRNGGILPGPGAQIDTVSYEDWLAAGAH